MGSITVSTVLVLTLSVLAAGAYAETFTVGGDTEWTVNPSFNYTDWARNISAEVGDTLIFTYSANDHDVRRVTSEQYEACDQENYIEAWETGDDEVILNSSGTWYFLCSKPQHCTLGQEFSIEVSSSSSTESPPDTDTAATAPSAAPSLLASLAGLLALSIVSGFSLAAGF